MRRYRVLVEVQMPNESSADDALVWMNEVLSSMRKSWAVAGDVKNARPHHVVSATPVRESQMEKK